jgi:hypothetical protein
MKKFEILMILQKFADGNLNSCDIDCCPYGYFINTLKNDGCLILDDDNWESNGWQGDYWVDLKVRYSNGQIIPFAISGSLYYGNLHIERTEESSQCSNVLKGVAE